MEAVSDMGRRKARWGLMSRGDPRFGGRLIPKARALSLGPAVTLVARQTERARAQGLGEASPENHNLNWNALMGYFGQTDSWY
jgi:hypothetical protein